MVVLNDANDIYFGDRPADRVYLGAEKVWPLPLAELIGAAVSVDSTTTATGSTPPIDTTGANLLAVAIATRFTSGVPAPNLVDDTYGNAAWIEGRRITTIGVGRRAQLYIRGNPTVGPGHTFYAWWGASILPSLAVAAFRFPFADIGQDANEHVNPNVEPTTVTSTNVVRRRSLLISSCSFGGAGTGAEATIDHPDFSVAASRPASALSTGVALAWAEQAKPGLVTVAWDGPSADQAASLLSIRKAS